MKVVLYADTAEDARDALVSHMRHRLGTLKSNAEHGRLKRDRDRAAGAAHEIEMEAQWLSKVEFAPKASAPGA